VRENAEFLGWVAKEEVAVEGTPPKPPTRVVKPEPEPKQEKKEEPEEKILTIEETHEKLLKLREVPVSSGPMYKETYNLDGMRHTRSGSGSTGMALFGGQEASLQVLALFDPDEVVEWFVEERIRELKKLGQEAHPSFHRVIDWYIKGLEAYVERKPRDLERFVNQAERFWKTIPGVPEVGF
jgi:hypothetical protein